MSHNSKLKSDEIDLSELFAALWSHKLFIALFTGLSIFLGGYNALKTEKKFKAKSIFQIEQNDSSSGFNFPSELGALASLAGFSGSPSTSNIEILLERAKGREFIIDMNKKIHSMKICISTVINTTQITKNRSGRRKLKKLLNGKKLN